jgi:dTDP-4-dehydrorhamnose 3,5-epimerase
MEEPMAGGGVDLLTKTLDAATKQAQSVTSHGEPISGPLEDSGTFNVPTHVDDRGFLVELFRPDWDWVQEPFAYSYVTTVRPGHAKGWGLHKLHVDRYFLLFGEVELVMYDVRPESSTYGRISLTRLSEYNRALIRIPTFVWHAMRNLGSKDVVVINFPTSLYDHANPDKYGLPLNTPLIPYSFEGTPGW